MGRRLFRDPPPLPPDAPAFVDEAAAEFYAAEKLNSELKMGIYDRSNAVAKRVDWVVGNINVARALVKDGIRTPEAAEVRAMLERRGRG